VVESSEPSNVENRRFLKRNVVSSSILGIPTEISNKKAGRRSCLPAEGVFVPEVSLAELPPLSRWLFYLR